MTRRGAVSAVQPAMEREYVEVRADLHDGGQLVLGWQFVELSSAAGPSHRFRHLVGRPRPGCDVLTHLTIRSRWWWKFVDTIAVAGRAQAGVQCREDLERVRGDGDRNATDTVPVPIRNRSTA